jgi:hypothetical protein
LPQDDVTIVILSLAKNPWLTNPGKTRSLLNPSQDPSALPQDDVIAVILSVAKNLAYLVLVILNVVKDLFYICSTGTFPSCQPNRKILRLRLRMT